jgi:TolA-binding protein
MRKLILTFPLAAALMAGCQSTPESQGRWNDMLTDIALRHKYEKYACGYHPLAGYSKDSDWRSDRVHTRSVAGTKAPEQPAPPQTPVRQDSEEIRELNGKLEVLEEALKSNVAATNQNQSLIVDQIREIKGRLDELKSEPPVAQSTPLPRQPESGIKIPGN